jgi:hypothetical protein
MICSAPRAPSFTGTPTNRPRIPYSPFEVNRAGKDFLFVLEDGFHHFDDGGRRRRNTPSRSSACLTISAPPSARAVHDAHQCDRLGQQVGEGNSGDGGVARQRHHGHHHGRRAQRRVHVFHARRRVPRTTNALMRAESNTPAMPITRSLGESADLEGRLGHGVERIGHHELKSHCGE